MDAVKFRINAPNGYYVHSNWEMSLVHIPRYRNGSQLPLMRLKNHRVRSTLPKPGSIGALHRPPMPSKYAYVTITVRYIYQQQDNNLCTTHSTPFDTSVNWDMVVHDSNHMVLVSCRMDMVSQRL